MLESVGNRHEGPRAQFLSSSFDSFQSHNSNRYVNAQRNRRGRHDSMLLYTKYVTERKQNMIHHASMDPMNKHKLRPMGYSVDSVDMNSLNTYGTSHSLNSKHIDKCNYRDFHPRSLTKKGGITSSNVSTFQSLEKRLSPLKTQTNKNGILRGNTFPSPDNPFLLINPPQNVRPTTITATDLMDSERTIRAPVNTPRVVKEKQAWNEPDIEPKLTPKENVSPKASRADVGNIQLMGVYIHKHTKQKPTKVERRKTESQKKLQYKPKGRNEDTISSKYGDPFSSNRISSAHKQNKFPATSEETSKETNSQQLVDLSEETLKNAINTLKSMEKELDKKSQVNTTTSTRSSKKGKRKRLKLPRQKLDVIEEGESETSDSDSSQTDRDRLSNPSHEALSQQSDEFTSSSGTYSQGLSEDVLDNLLTLAANCQSQGVRVDILKPIPLSKRGPVWKPHLTQPNQFRQTTIVPLTRKERAMGDIRNKMKQRKEHTIRHT